MATKRQKSNGKWEYVVKRAKLLPKPLYLTFDDEAQGDAYVAKLEAILDTGVVPHEFQEKAQTYTLLGELIQDYLIKVVVSASDKDILNVLYGRIGKTTMLAISYTWVESWISGMKTQLNLKPGTIRHHVGALGRCFDWAGRRNVTNLVINPIRQLPKSYAQYTARDGAIAKAFNDEHEPHEDEERDRRIEEGEEPRIRLILDKHKPENKERPLELRYQAALELLFDMALESAMRLREMFTLTLDQTVLEKRTFFLEKTKNGNKRQVPMSSVILEKIQNYYEIVRRQERGMNGFNFEGDRLFPWWDGSLDKQELAKVTRLLSRQFARVFDAAGCGDLRFHDLRHEATCRLFERTNLSDFEIMKIVGHSSTRMLRRYSNLRGSDLAEKMW